MENITLLSVNDKLFNNSRQNIIFDGNKYQSLPFEIIYRQKNADLAEDIISIKAIFCNGFSSAQEIFDVFKNANVKIWNLDASQKELLLEGSILQVSVKTSTFEFEIHGNLYRLKNTLNKKYSQKCRASFCDEDCGLKIQEQSYTMQILAVNGLSFTINATPPQKFWSEGLAKIIKNGKTYILRMRGANSNVVLLSENVPAEITSGDVLTIEPSCNKDLQTCSQIYNNAINFQGEPFLWR